MAFSEESSRGRGFWRVGEGEEGRVGKEGEEGEEGEEGRVGGRVDPPIKVSRNVFMFVSGWRVDA